MAKLVITNSDVTNKYISFISLDKNNTIFDSGILITNGVLKFNGNNPTNLSINSKNNLKDDSKSTNVFEFSNNDYVDLDNIDIVKKNVDDSNNIVSILSKGINVKDNSDSIVSINSIDNNIENSETITTINTKHSNIGSSRDIFTFGTNLDIQKSNSAIIIGNNINTNNTNENVMIGFNINTNNSNQILIGNFAGVNTKSMEVGISQGKNYLYKSGDIFHVSKNLILDENLRNDKSNSNIGRNCVILGDGIVTYEDNSNENDIILSNNTKITNTEKSIILGESLKINDNTSSIFGGLNNETIESTSTLVFGDSNETSYILNDYIIGYNNNNKSVINSIIYGASNTNANVQNSFIGGIFNNVAVTTNNLIAGQSHNISNPYGSFIIGEQFHSNKTKGEYKESYIISNQNTSICFNSYYISIGNNEPVTYMKFVEDSKGFAEYYSEFKYSLVSSFRYTNLKNNNFSRRFKMGKRGFCTLHCDYSPNYAIGSIPLIINIFDNDNGEVVYNINYDGNLFLNYKSYTLTSYIHIQYDNIDDGYDIGVNFSFNAIVYSFIEKSSKCAICDEPKVLYNNAAKYYGGFIYNLVSSNDYVFTYKFYTKSFDENREKIPHALHIDNLNVSENYIVDTPYFRKIRDDVPKYNYYVFASKMGSEIEKYYENIVGDTLPLRELWNSTYTIGHPNDTSHKTANFSLLFYNKEIQPYDWYILNVGGRYDLINNNTTAAPLSTLKFKKDNILYKYYDLQRNLYISAPYEIKQNGTNYTYNLKNFGGLCRINEYKEYLDGLTRTNSPDYRNPNSKVLDNRSFLNEVILKFLDGTKTREIDFSLNHNNNSIVKWGIFANASLSAITCIADSFGFDFPNYGYSTMETKSLWNEKDTLNQMRCAVPGGETFNIDIKSGQEDKIFGDNRYMTYTQKIMDSDTRNPYPDGKDGSYFKPVYIPFMFTQSTNGKTHGYLHSEYMSYIANKYDFRPFDILVSFAPKNKNLRFITTVHNFTAPLNVYIKYNTEMSYQYWKINNDGTQGFTPFAMPLFNGKISFNEESSVSTFKDYKGGFRYGTSKYDKDGRKYNSIKNMNCTNFRYLNIMNPTTADDVKFKPFIRVNDKERMNFTYMLKYLTTPIT